MFVFALRRIGGGVTRLVAVTLMTYALVFASGPDIARNVLGPNANAAQVQATAHKLGVDRPVIVQYLDWLSHAVRGDLGTSYITNQPVADALSTRVPVTLSLVAFTMILTVVLSVVLGVAAATKGGAFDRVTQAVSTLGYALPNYLIALGLIFVFALTLKFVPATGYVPLTSSPLGWLSSILLPSIALTITGVASIAQQVRSAMIDVLRQDYVKLLRSRGISTRAIIWRHALRNAAAPALTITALYLIVLMGGVVVIERVSSLPGIGQLAIQASNQSDIPILMGVIAFMVFVILIVNVLLELAIGWLNPKARLR